jgi:hypothetical protein
MLHIEVSLKSHMLVRQIYIYSLEDLMAIYSITGNVQETHLSSGI